MASAGKPKRLLGFMFNSQPWTWAEHALITTLVPLVVAEWSKTHWLYPVLAILVALAYNYKEQYRDKPLHKKAGNWRLPDWLGVTPLVDGWVDAMTPAVAAFAGSVGYLVARFA